MRDIISHIRPIATARAFKRQSILLYQGEVPRDAFVVLSGVVKAYSINAAGEEQIVTFETRGDMFPASWIFQKAATTIYYYEALTDVEVLALPQRDLNQLLADDLELRAKLLDYFATRYTGLLMRVTALEQSRAREKIMFTLYYLMFRYGRQRHAGSGVYAIGLKLTHSVIAALVGLTRETTTNELTKLKSERILSYGSHQYSVDKAKLERALGEDSFANLQTV
ncbi:MAG TPA: Crp/Fnr family transcriptional regulator [Candidatus Saccharimonadales bacterium]|nr:Crp/Fnr family transcriptional regulator [Candidatus Saccharimonadales bacterium]